MYPRNAPNPLTEELVLAGELEPTNEGYALAKIVTARLCDYIRREQPEFQYKTMIPCNLYGRHDKFSPAHSHLIPAIIHKIHAAQKSGTTTADIWGDGHSRREFMYAGDFADAVMHGLAHFDTMPDLLNIGIGHDYTINEYYAAVAGVIGWQGTFEHDLSKPVGMRQKLVSTARQQAWGWQARTGLAEGIQHTYQYFLENNAK
jgi:GDP-L-fucose synthase